MTKTSLKFVLPVLFLALIVPFSAKAFAVKTGAAVNIGANEVIDGNLYAAGSSLLIDGQVKGDVVCAGQSVIINGRVDGDVLCAAQSINVLGEVVGSVRVAGSDVSLNNKIGRNLMAFGASVSVGSNSDISFDALLAAGVANVNGKVGGSLHGSAGMVTLNGEVGKDVALNLDSGEHQKLAEPMANLVVTDKAKIGGNLEYASVAVATIDQSAKIGGQINHQMPKMSGEKFKNQMFGGLAMVWLWYKIIALFGALLIGLLLVLFFKKQLLAFFDNMVVGPKMAIGWGALIVLLMPLVLIFLVMTMIGIPLATLLGLLWIVAIMLGKLLVSVFAGFVIMGRYRQKKIKEAAKTSTGLAVLSMVIGVTVSCALFVIPIFGWLLGLLATIWGVGALCLAVKKSLS